MVLVPCNCLFNWFPLDEDLNCVCRYLEDQSHPSTLSLSPWTSLRSISSVTLSTIFSTNSTRVTGNLLRIRFVFKKPREAEVVVPQEDRVCSTSGTEISSSVSEKKRNIRQAKNPGTVPCLSIEEDNSNSDDWLLGTRRQENVSTKSTMNEDMVMNLQKPGESCFPSSQFLSEVGIFSLPYTVLF
ncbi:hypothetical protein IGI04_031282 [Brassica rapa subsp. trilocularis]|uniref:Uncharacterized protein n=1 Tax=Brassica rapa subsp. trilocularis TaxID=1813537 RepID=A0ABQ7LVI4_BRACM|nr:hypothetical protein IGI04_031282 [Brassica rapa subsp. trilocularis]